MVRFHTFPLNKMITFLWLLLFWLPFWLIFISVAEYIAHRWTMHDKKMVELTGVDPYALETHAKLHHGRFYKNFEGDPDPIAKHISIDLYPSYLVFGLTPLWGSVMYFFSLPGGILLVLLLIAWGTIWTAFHREMHNPAGRRICYLLGPYYRWCYAYHRRHHERPSCNYNALIPLFDFVFGTYDGLSPHKGSKPIAP